MTDAERLYELLYSCESRDEMCERVVRMEALVRDMWRDGMCECDERGACAQCEYHFPDRMRELGIEVGQ